MSTVWEKLFELHRLPDIAREGGAIDAELDELRHARARERESEVPRAPCCSTGRRFLVARRMFEPGKMDDPVAKPTWGIYMGLGFHNGHDRSFVIINFCPFCGARLPDLRRKAEPPSHLCIEGDFRCGRCHERYDGCFCSWPEAAWEPVP